MIKSLPREVLIKISIMNDNNSVTNVENLTIKDSWYDKESMFMYITNIYHTSKGAALLGTF